jgi:hypothetical protein
MEVAKEGVMNPKASKHLRTLGVIAAVALLAVSVDAADIKCKVPFAFTVNQSTLPPGDYTISTTGGGVLFLRGDTRGAVVLTNGLESWKESNPKMVFYRYGDRYFLRELWTGGGAGRELPRLRVERDLKAARFDFERIEIAGPDSLTDR